jgi:hypothetical protein
MIKEYQIAVIYTIKANTYEEALSIVEQGTLTNDQAAVVYDYESDNEGQRVVYLPGIDDTTGPDAEDVDYNATDKDTGPYLGAHERGEG